MKAFSSDLRARVFAACEDGATSEVAEQFSVSPAFVRRLKQRHRESGSIAPKMGGRGPAPKRAGHEVALRAAVAERPDDTPAEHRARLALPASVSTVARAMRRLGLTRKKSRSGPPNRTART
jgi:transposase